MMAAWEHHSHHVARAFGSSIAFARALKAVAPPHGRTEPLRAWRGVLLKKGGDPCEAALGPSWTTDRGVAAWFAMRFYTDGLRPFVFCANFEPGDIVAFNEERNEAEVIVHPIRSVFIDQDGTSPLALSRLAVPSLAALSAWQECYERVLQRRQKSPPVCSSKP